MSVVSEAFDRIRDKILEYAYPSKEDAEEGVYQDLFWVAADLDITKYQLIYMLYGISTVLGYTVIKDSDWVNMTKFKIYKYDWTETIDLTKTIDKNYKRE